MALQLRFPYFTGKYRLQRPLKITIPQKTSLSSTDSCFRYDAARTTRCMVQGVVLSVTPPYSYLPETYTFYINTNTFMPSFYCLNSSITKL